jgi:hypothetical protein
MRLIGRLDVILTGCPFESKLTGMLKRMKIVTDKIIAANGRSPLNGTNLNVHFIFQLV